MADEAREYLVAAQQAELRGDKPQAVDLLMKAATVYRQRGQTARALQMLRHASRLDGTRSDISDEVRRMEWMPDRPFLRAVTEAEEVAEEQAALKPLEDLALKPDEEFTEGFEKQLIERGPTKADPALNAWCSFCCRPKTEVGELVAGPAGAYVCVTCVQESAKLLGVTFAPAPAAEAKPSPLAPVQPPGAQAVIAGPTGQPERSRGPGSNLDAPAPAPPEQARGPAELPRPKRAPVVTVDPVGQERAVKVLETALRLEVGSVLLLGPTGAGKTAHLRDLERRGLGVYVASPADLVSAPDDLPAFVDHADEATPQEWELIARAIRGGRSAAVVLAVRGVLPEPEVMLTRDGEELPLYATAALEAATEGRIPAEVLERVQVAVSFTPATREELIEVARRLAALRAAELNASEELLASMAELAQASGRQGHELRALLGRLPPGEWTAKKVTREPAAPEKKPSRRRKKSDEG